MSIDLDADEAPRPGERADAAADRNGVAVHFTDGETARYALVVRDPETDWLYAERLVGDGDGLDEEEVETINPDAVRRVRSAGAQRVDGAVVHHGESLFVDPEAVLAEARR